MSAHKVINCLISQPKHAMGTQKNRLNEMLFYAPNYRLNLLCKKILTILRSKIVFI